MRIPSIIRLPRYKSFDYAPRHYDPVKEDIAERTRRLKQELDEDIENNHTSSIAGAFKRKTSTSFTGSNYSASLVQLIIAVVLLGTFVGYLFYGNQVFYVLLLGAPVYLFFRLKGIFFKK